MPPAFSPSVLLHNPWFAALSAGLRRDMLAATERRHLQPGEMLFRQGHAPDGFYALLQGKLKMSTLNQDGREAILTMLDIGTWFGEISLIDGQPRTHDATAVGHAEILVMPPAVFGQLMEQAEFAGAVARMLAARIRLLYGLVEDASLRSVRHRVARRLVLLANSHAPVPHDSPAAIPVTQESLAMMLGISRQSLSKELKFFEQHGVLTLGYGQISLLSVALLTRLSEAD